MVGERAQEIREEFLSISWNFENLSPVVRWTTHDNTVYVDDTFLKCCQ